MRNFVGASETIQRRWRRSIFTVSALTFLTGAVLGLRRHAARQLRSVMCIDNATLDRIGSTIFDNRAGLLLAPLAVIEIDPHFDRLHLAFSLFVGGE
jgi:hypothetical protein